MKHNKKVTLIILTMFLLTQFIGLYVVNEYSHNKELPYGMQVPEIDGGQDYNSNIVSIIFAFIIAIVLLSVLTKFKAKYVMKTWFFFVTTLALGLAFTAFLPKSWGVAPWVALALALPLALSKIYKRNILTHNFSELLIYPGIAAVFVPLLNLLTIIILLVLISIYDMWAVWRSGIMQKMAKYQMDEIKVFSGFYLPYLTKKQSEKVKRWKEEKTDLTKKKMKINIAILGGGDVVFPIITAGVVLNTWGIWPGVGVALGALAGLASLLIFSEKKKFYPAMPFISAGIFLSMLISWIFIRFI